jgi:hypothetical protein
VRAGAERLRDSGCHGCLSGVGEFGAGFSFYLFSERSLFFLLADAQILLPASGFWNTLRGGIGPSGGLRIKLSPQLIALGTGVWSYLPAQKPLGTWRADGALRWQYQPGFAFDVATTVQPDAWSAQIASVFYF